MSATASPCPRGTNQHPYLLGPFPFNPADPFNVATLGVSRVGGISAPAWDTFAHLVQPSLASDAPIANPTNCATAGGWWLGNLDNADMVELLPFCVGYNGGGTAYVAPAVAESYSVAVWSVRRMLKPRTEVDGRMRTPRSAIATPACRLTFTAGPQLASGDPDFPSSTSTARGRLMDSCTITEDGTLTPGVRGVGRSPGAVCAVFDLRGCEGLIVYPYGMPSNRGLGLWRSHL
jgi:hypothetical protein